MKLARFWEIISPWEMHNSDVRNMVDGFGKSIATTVRIRSHHIAILHLSTGDLISPNINHFHY